MNALAIFALIEKGITVAQVLIEAGRSAAPAFEALKNLISGAKRGEVTEEDITKTEAQLDSMISEFNEPI